MPHHRRAIRVTRETAAAALLGVFAGALAVSVWTARHPAPPPPAPLARSATAKPEAFAAPRPPADTAGSGDSSPEALLQSEEGRREAPPPERTVRRAKSPGAPRRPSGANDATYATAASEPNISSDTRAAIYVAGAWRSYRGGNRVSAQRLLASAYAVRADLHIDPSQYDAGFRELARDVRAGRKDSF